MKDLLKAALMSQDMGETGVDRICKQVEGGNYEIAEDPVSSVIVWALESDTISGEPDYDSISTNFDYAINQLRRAQAVVDNYRKG